MEKFSYLKLPKFGVLDYSNFLALVNYTKSFKQKFNKCLIFGHFMTQLILCEKPSAALKIADSLADGKVTAYKEDGVPYYNIQIKGKKVIVCCTVGHLFNLAEKKKEGSKYPVFDVEWRESFKVKKKSAYTQKYFDLLKELSKDADEFIVATDKDLEGEVIGWNILRYIFNKKDGLRMEFSTLTKDDLIDSYKNVKKHLDFPLAYSGETRHIMDWIWGINMSRALTLAIKSAGAFKLMSSGRVQGPALNLIVKREKEIQNFKPVPFWLVNLISDKFTAGHIKGDIWDKKEAETILKNTEGNKAFIKKISKREFLQEPPYPFDLTSLQVEAYRTLHISPKETLSIAQDLYINGYISYPRTSSQKLPSALNFKKIFEKLKKNNNYEEICSELLNKNVLIPNEGKKSDPAHPSVHPTGEFAKVDGKGFKLYDLIVRRFLSTFGEPAKKQTNTLNIDVNNELFSVSGTITLEKGWQKYYGKYALSKDVELPKLKEMEEVKVKEIKIENKETQPPKRYIQASIIKELDKKFLGTKSTRAAILDTLYQRNYIKDNSIQATELGIKLIDTLQKYSEEIIDEKLTRHFEKEMEKIREGKADEQEILGKAKETLIKIFDKFKEHETDIGKELLVSQRKTEEDTNTLGQCPKCEKGNLKILYSPKTKSKFVGCSSYPECKNIYSLPRNGLIKKLEEKCKECNFYQVLVIRAGKRPWKLCLTPNCKSKEAWAKPFDKSLHGKTTEALPKNEDKTHQGKTTEEKETPKNKDEQMKEKSKIGRKKKQV